MTVYSKHNYEDQDDRRILKAARKQQYIMFPAPIAFLNDELKSELGMKSKKEEEEDDAKFCSLKVPMDHEDKESKTYVVKVKKYDSGTPEDFLKWRLIYKKQKTKRTRRRTRRCIPPNKFMIAQFLNWQFVLLTSKVDGEMPMRGRENIREEIFSWGNSTHKSSVKDCKI
jgi:hypothetical protein